jgi:hypothetical protein
MPRLWVNNAASVLATAVGGSDTALSVASGTGALFPAPTGGDYAILTLERGGASTVRELVRLTGRVGDVLTVVRAQEGTSAQTFSEGDTIELRVTAQGMANLADVTEPVTLLNPVTSPPPAPTSGVRLYPRTRASRTMLETVGPSGVDYPLQPAFFGNRVMLINPGSGTGLGSVGLTPTTAATLSHPTPATTTLAESLYRTRFQTSTTAGNAAGVRDAVNTIWRGNASGRGGFFVHTRFCTGSIALAGGQVAIVLTSDTGLLAGEPSALANVLGLVKDSAHTTWRLARRTGTGTVQLIDTAETYAVNLVYDLILFARPGWDRVGARFVRQNFDGSSTVLYDDVWTTDLPATTTLVGRKVEVRNGAVAAAANVELVRSYCESDL